MTSPLNRASAAAFLVIVKISGMAGCGGQNYWRNPPTEPKILQKQSDLHESIAYFGLFRWGTSRNSFAPRSPPCRAASQYLQTQLQKPCY